MSCVVQDFKSPEGLWVKSYRVDGKQIFTRSWKLWHDIQYRCKVDGVYQKSRPTYVGCVNSFIDYQSFAGWCQIQVGYSATDECGRCWALDKDVLNTKNSIGYGPDNCCFLPIELNSLLQIQVSGRNGLPLGVIYSNRKRSPYKAQINTKGKNTYLGAYASKIAAHKAWQDAKIVRIKEMISKYRGKVDHRVIDMLSSIVCKIEEDIIVGSETTKLGGVPLAV